jgi:hypothetical protein
MAWSGPIGLPAGVERDVSSPGPPESREEGAMDAPGTTATALRKALQRLEPAREHYSLAFDELFVGRGTDHEQREFRPPVLAEIRDLAERIRPSLKLKTRSPTSRRCCRRSLRSGSESKTRAIAARRTPW